MNAWATMTTGSWWAIIVVVGFGMLVIGFMGGLAHADWEDEQARHPMSELDRYSRRVKVYIVLLTINLAVLGPLALYVLAVR